MTGRQEAATRRQQISVEVLGPWPLATNRSFWEGFPPSALTAQDGTQRLDTVFRVDADWSRAEASVTQCDGTARITVAGEGDLDAAAAQVRRFPGTSPGLLWRAGVGSCW